MSNDERREKRVQASLRVRYKSATVTEFIEKHSHDISPGGVFIRSQKPLSKGSLLKIDFRLEDDSAVIQGVGRVVWTRDESTEGKPAGMGIKFIRLDENSKDNIQKIISMQKAGMEITRASVFGEPDDDAENDVTVPDGKSVRDSIAPSVENLPPTSADESPVDDEYSIESADDPGRDEAEEITERSRRNISGDSDNRASSETTPEATVFPGEKEKSGNWGMIAVIALLVGGALIYAMMQRPGTEESENAAGDATGDTDETPGEATDGAEPGDTAADADTPEDTAGNVGAMPAATDTDSTEGTDSGTDSDSATDSGSDTETVTDTSGDSDTTTAATESAAAAGMSGEVVISINEPDATVALDGKVHRESMPILLSGLPVGEHEILANLFGFRPLVTTVTAVAGEPLTVSLKLKRAKQVATFKANVVGVRVFVGDKQIGRTPMRTVKRLNDSFEYTLEKTGFEPFTGTVSRDDWTYDEGVYEVTVAATLTPKAKDDTSGAESGAPDAATPAVDTP